MPDRWQLMNGSTQFVKDVRMLNLPREITEHALRLIDQCELPVVIWPNTKQAARPLPRPQRTEYRISGTIASTTDPPQGISHSLNRLRI